MKAIIFANNRDWITPYSTMPSISRRTSKFPSGPPISLYCFQHIQQDATRNLVGFSLVLHPIPKQSHFASSLPSLISPLMERQPHNTSPFELQAKCWPFLAFLTLTSSFKRDLMQDKFSIESTMKFKKPWPCAKSYYLKLHNLHYWNWDSCTQLW